MGFFHSFIATLMNSTWQAALLSLLHLFISLWAKKMHPLQKRNILYNLLFLQLILSIGTFFIFYLEKVDFVLLQIQSINWLGQYSYILFYGYLLVVLFRFSTIVIQWNIFRSQYKKVLLKPSAEINIFVISKAYQLGIKRKVSIWYSKYIEVPITFGFLKPIILLPISLLNNISLEETETIILHELTHIKSKDYLLNWYLMIMEILYFFNPFIKIITENIKKEREKNCDVEVINFKYNEILYAQVLLKIASLRHSTHNFHIGATSKSASLLDRIVFFTESKNILFKRYNRSLIALPLLFILFWGSLILIPYQNKGVSKKYVTNDTRIDITSFKTKLPSFELNEKPFTTQKIYEKSNVEIVNKVTTSKKIEKKDELKFETDYYNDEMYKQVSFNDMLIDSIKEVQYNIETSNGKITKSYKLYKQNELWVMEPNWTITETKEDSILYDKIIYMEIDSVQ
jgi:beta-lactamase regulating signal transducer with metallopeptidase domain